MVMLRSNNARDRDSKIEPTVELVEKLDETSEQPESRSPFWMYVRVLQYVCSGLLYVLYFEVYTYLDLLFDSII